MRPSGFLAAWLASGRPADGTAGQLHDLVATKLGDDSALAALRAEATAGVAGERTRRRAALSLEDAAESDHDFAVKLAALLSAGGVSISARNGAVAGWSIGSVTMNSPPDPAAGSDPGSAAATISADRGGVAAGLMNVIQLGAGRVAVRSAYRQQIARIAPPELVGREAELAELADFCLRPDGPAYVWWRAAAWAGKSALMSTFALHPPAGMVVVPFFITARLAAQDDRHAFTDVLLEQLTALLDDDLPPLLTEATRDAHVLGLLDRAAKLCRASDRRLILLVDGLDEDRGVTAGPNSYSIAALLPANPPDGMRVVVAGRPNPPIPDDVPAWHPLRRGRVREGRGRYPGHRQCARAGLGRRRPGPRPDRGGARRRAGGSGAGLGHRTARRIRIEPARGRAPAHRRRPVPGRPGAARPSSARRGVDVRGLVAVPVRGGPPGARVAGRAAGVRLIPPGVKTGVGRGCFVEAIRQLSATCPKH
ncbi:hypothetical protein BJ973_003119 [Actinoplanes tereljensis]|uniref:Uncharacterized protein n=1 Tax=Paractinoplanes tereljensis TaxID=571912 RepID=A0A919NX51_9ACTN|nr:hypothetical protein [Actinoplanes tereljensis]GIF25845.1 hypothetical protein Ate02nite_85750 [Actinoplanes tereljensis]